MAFQDVVSACLSWYLHASRALEEDLGLKPLEKKRLQKVRRLRV